MTLDFHSRIAVRHMVKMKLSELHGPSFEEFFQDLMCLRYKDFADVRTAGSLGDLSSDGLSLVNRKLYACYGPEVFSAYKVIKKLKDDLAGALSKRAKEFDVFVFVHSELRGMHPIVTSELSAARSRHPHLAFENFGMRRFRDEACQLRRDQVEDLLGHEIPVNMVFSVSLDEVIPLLEHLSRERPHSPQQSIVQPSADKLDFNEFCADTKDELRKAMVQTREIDQYYQLRDDITERDEVALAFHAEYMSIREKTADPEQILHNLEQYILGNASASYPKRRAASAILAYFFESCDIFENPPAGWSISGARR
ncbi:ABC-three component system protein [Pseudonocardia spinosispora]|uniref:ABC-three component system protein n=1 Tax=Pseudonocardia spinosispora TaxID=103441 RepID=UPI0012EC2B5E|nr:ABC-three component system protein [Pseudonocardia spinosispora]